jgi:hypothetical protein
MNFGMLSLLFGLVVSSPVFLTNDWNRFHGSERRAAALAIADARRYTARARCYEMPEDQACRVFEAEEVNRAWVTIAVRELHSPKCGGDPHSAPVLGRLRVSRRDHSMTCWHGGEDVYTPCTDACQPSAPYE